MVLAIFDFDGTITNRDSFRHFLQYSVTKSDYYRGLIILSPVLIAYTLGLVPANVAKQKVFARFFGGWASERFGALAERYSSSEIGKIVRPVSSSAVVEHSEVFIELLIGQFQHLSVSAAVTVGIDVINRRKVEMLL